MRQQTLPGFKSQTGLLPGMLKRTKYSRLRNDSLSSLEDHPQRILTRDLCLDSDFAQLDPATSAPHHGTSTLRDFIPRVANIRLQSPLSLRGLRGQSSRDRTGHSGKSLSRIELNSGPEESFCRNSSVSVAPSADQNLIHPALHCTKRPISLHRMASLPWTPGCAPCSQHTAAPSCWKASSSSSSAADDCAVAGTANRAVHHHIKYMGSVEVTQSMRTLDFDTRMQVTREAISRLCERISGKTTVKTKRPVCKALSAVLGQINLQFSGSGIIVSVSTDSVTLISASSLQKIAHHPMQAISFASGGDPDMADYIAYVAKDFMNQRACHILECPRGRAGDVIDSIGQAFEARFRQLLSHTPSFLSSSPSLTVPIRPKWRPKEASADQSFKHGEGVGGRRDYYNVIPGKTPPHGGVEDLRVTRGSKKQDADLQEVCLSQPLSMYENCSITEGTTAPSAADSHQSGFGVEEFSPASEIRIQDLILEEGWFHGRLGREQAESLLTCSGDFLVRESSSASGQYVLSGMEGATVRHLLLVDPHGQVRTRDQVFLSVGHLVRFHMENQMPIVSGSSELCLKQPILQTH